MRTVDSPDVLRQLLRSDPVANAYALGMLDPAYFGYARCYANDVADDVIDALVMVYGGLSLPVVITSGAPEPVMRLLREAIPQLPARYHFQVAHEHAREFEKLVRPAWRKPMMRMSLVRDDFVAHEHAHHVQVLGHRDTADIMALYGHYPDNFFEPSQLGSGLYFGVRCDDVLVSVAGIHVLSETDDIAAIGNLVTHPEWRGRGYALACTSTLLTALFERVGLVTLNTDPHWEPAARTFSHLGFREQLRYVEGRLQ